MASIALHGGTSAVNLGGGYALRTPGLRGSAQILGPRVAGTRGPELATGLLDQAFADARIEDVATIDMQVSEVAFPSAAAPVRGPSGADAFELQVPDLGPETGQVVLSVDEAGALRWHFPLDDDLGLQPSTVRGAAGLKVFLVPREIAQTPSSASGDARGLVSVLGRKILKVLAYPIADALLGPLTERAVGNWEGRRRPYGFRRFRPGDYAPLVAEDWSRLQGGRALLFVHGIFSTSRDTFGGLPPKTLAALAKRYEDRVFAFDHPTVSVSPLANVEWFMNNLPEGQKLDLDIVSHSRGGLTSRGIIAAGDGRISVSRLVLAGVPNQGTVLVNADHMVEFLDRITTIVNVLPDSTATSMFEAVLTVVKVIGHVGLVALDGFSAMSPGSQLIQQLGAVGDGGIELYGIGADFEPAALGLRASLCMAADSVVDRVFGEAPNDTAVPVDGMHAWGGAARVPSDQFLLFSRGGRVLHTNYFDQPETWAHLLDWLH